LTTLTILSGGYFASVREHIEVHFVVRVTARASAILHGHVIGGSTVVAVFLFEIEWLSRVFDLTIGNYNAFGATGIGVNFRIFSRTSIVQALLFNVGAINIFVFSFNFSVI
jgi:hypothetical protein